MAVLAAILTHYMIAIDYPKGLKIWDNIKYKILEPKWRQVFSSDIM